MSRQGERERAQVAGGGVMGVTAAQVRVNAVSNETESWVGGGRLYRVLHRSSQLSPF